MVSFTTISIAIMACFYIFRNIESVTMVKTQSNIGPSLLALTLSEARFVHLFIGPKIMWNGAK